MSHIKSILVEKQNTPKELPKPVKAKRNSEVLSEEIITRKYNIVYANGAHTSRPRKRDTDCVTLVRSRCQNLKNCNCLSTSPAPARRREHLNELADKLTQTDHPEYVNKASSICAQTCSCGTQHTVVLDYKLPLYNSLAEKDRQDTCAKNATIATEYIKTLSNYKNEMRKALLMDNETNKIREYGKGLKKMENNEFDVSRGLTTQNFMGARKWALSKYMTKGPDF
ncbi:hypothetical protein O0L34_g3026 [Tuta absoluta]|nr:hypothetical protein O0L34_g3026 [Tuta absoluta]